MWQVKPDRVHLTHGEEKFMLFSSRNVGFMMFWRSREKGRPDQGSESINDGGVCRTAPVTPGLFKINAIPLALRLKEITCWPELSSLTRFRV